MDIALHAHEQQNGSKIGLDYSISWSTRSISKIHAVPETTP